MSTNSLSTGDCQRGDGEKRRGILHRESRGPAEPPQNYEIFQK